MTAPTSQTWTLQQLRARAQRLADEVASDFWTTDEWNVSLNASLAALYDKLIEAYPSGTYSKLPPYTFVTDGSSAYYPLPADFYKLQGVDCALGSAANGYITLRPFGFAERNKYANAGGATAAIASPWTKLQYRLIGDGSAAPQLMLGTPGTLAQAGLNMQIWYVPKLVPMVDIAQITLDPQAWGRVDSTGAGIVSGDAELVIDGITTEDDTVVIGLFSGLDSTAAAVAIAAQIESMFGESGSVEEYGITATAENNVITLAVPSTQRAIAYESNTEYALCSASEIVYGTTTFDGFNGYLEWPALTTAREVLANEESDTSAVDRKLAVLEGRIEKAAELRDVGAPAQPIDVNATGNGFPYGVPWE